MKYVQITVDGVTYTLREQSNGDWSIVNKAPYVSGEYPVTVTVTTEAGQIVNIDVPEDSLLAEALLLIVTEGTTMSGDRMLKYYPEVIRRIVEFQALMKTEGFEIDFLSNDIDISANEAYLTTMSEVRVIQWEKLLKIKPNDADTLQDRRDCIVARLRGHGKLNTSAINSIVAAFTGGTAISYIKDSVLYVKVTPPPKNKQYKFENVDRELRNRQPAHLGLSVTRNYSTWEDVYSKHTDWNAISKYETWDDLKTWVSQY